VRVLIVDDHEDARAALRGFVQLQGHEVVASVADGGAALEVASRLKPDLVLIDVRLGSESGLDLARTLTTRDSDLPVVRVSVDDVPAADVRASGARSCITKRALVDTDLATFFSD
jgi:DNA-binding NarL/FixJ family response regulator